MKRCKHCGHTPANRPRGLCWKCSNDPVIREPMPPVSKHGRRGLRDHDAGFSIPRPTAEAPGSPGKVDVLVMRAAAGLSLWSPLDVDFGAWEGKEPPCGGNQRGLGLESPEHEFVKRAHRIEKNGLPRAVLEMILSFDRVGCFTHIDVQFPKR